MQAGVVPRSIFGERQPGAALRFLQAPAVVRRKNRLSARGFTGYHLLWPHSRYVSPAARPCILVGVLVCGSGGDRVQWTKQGAAAGCAAEALPAAETAEAEQGQPSKYASGRRPAQHIWRTATRSRAPIFASTRRGAPQKSAKRKRTLLPLTFPADCSKVSANPSLTFERPEKDFSMGTMHLIHSPAVRCTRTT